MEGQQDQNLEKGDSTVVQEASSTTPGEEVVTKSSIRLQTWKKLKEAKCGVGFRAIFNKIPNFVNREKAAALLAETEEFKNAKNIKVNIDRPQDPVKMHIVSSGKNLYLPPARGSNCLFTKIECPDSADEKLRRRIIQIQNWKEHRKDIALDECVKLDMVVIGSVAVSRDGRRIGRGGGFVDLDVGILTQVGAITPQTIIVTTVHNLQVLDEMPAELFKNYDVPVDLIVTPSEVIHVKDRLPRPSGVLWEILSERRVNMIPVLQALKEKEEKSGKTIVLRNEDTDIETNGPPRPQRRRPFYKYRVRRTRSEANNDNVENEKPRKRRFNRRRRQTKSEGEQSSGETKENDQNQNQNQNRPVRKKRNNRDFCIKVSKIARGVRIKDLKAELRKRECNPVYISWKGNYGKCYLHFAKKKGMEMDEEIEKVLKSLHDLSLTIESGERTKTINLEVELLKIKDDNTIESVNTSTV